METVTAENTAIIYGIKPKDGDLFYIGSTEKSKEERFGGHLTAVRRGTHNNKFFARLVKHYKPENLEVVELDRTTTRQKETRELDLIAEHLGKGLALTNLVRLSDDKRRSIFTKPERSIAWPKPERFAMDLFFFLYTSKDAWTPTNVILSLHYDQLIRFKHQLFIKPTMETRRFIRSYMGIARFKRIREWIKTSEYFPEIRDNQPIRPFA